MDIGDFSLLNDDPVCSQIGSKFGLGLYLIVATSVKLNAAFKSAMGGELAGEIGFQPDNSGTTSWKPIPLSIGRYCLVEPERLQIAKC